MKISPKQPDSQTIIETITPIKPIIITVVSAKVPAAKSAAKVKGKQRAKGKYPSSRDFAKKKPQVRKAEKGKDYGWLYFLGLPKMKLPDFLGFNSDQKQKALGVSKAAQKGEQVPVNCLFCPFYIIVQSSSSSKLHLIEEIYFPGRSREKKNLEKASTDAR